MSNLLDLLIDIEDQRHWNSCGGQAASTYMEAVWFKLTGEKREFSAAFIWVMSKELSKKTGNVGVPLYSIFQVLMEYGCALEEDYPYTDENLSTLPSKEVLKKALQYRIKKWKSCKLEEINSYIDTGLPVFVLINYPTGHFVDVFGHEDGKRLIVNSWGNAWGTNGTTWIDDSEFQRIFRSGAVITQVEGLFKIIGRKFVNLFKRKTT